ncbi:hypothetical protein EN801_020435 [Mesorhizobium sp. M00.F.Ca.ET.158.01.1.1]|nr:hypothetical protein EN801_020435 [Mesorhizobium sp. M00.F.Ca.ET.158.01.1.1]
MAQTEHPIKAAAVAVGGTIGVMTLLFTGIVLPTMTASRDNKIDALGTDITSLKAKVSGLENNVAAGQQALNDLRQASDEERRKNKKTIEDLNSEIKGLQDQLFTSQQTNIFFKGDPYPVGFDKIKLGDSKDKIMSVFPSGAMSDSGHQITIEDTSAPIFRIMKFKHYDEKAPSWTVDSIDIKYDDIGRILDHSPKIPKNWLKDALVKTLGDPFVVGIEEQCSLWKVGKDAVVYYINNQDWFEISGFVTYPGGCSPTEKQLKTLKAAKG